MTNREKAKLLRSAASALEHGRYTTAQKKLIAAGLNDSETFAPTSEMLKLVRKLERTFDGDSNDAEHDAAYALVDYIRSLPKTPEPPSAEDLARDERIRDLARDQHEREGEVEIAYEAIVSEGDDNGAYVQAWVWADFHGTNFDKE